MTTSTGRKGLCDVPLPWTLKTFERVVLGLLVEKDERFVPKYVMPKTSRALKDIWTKTPEACRPRVPRSREERKRWQVESMVNLVLLLINRMKTVKNPTVVDFCGGTGQVGLVVAALAPFARVIIADICETRIELAKERIRQSDVKNVTVWCGDVRYFDRSFDLGVALHACGAASDIVMEMCAKRNAAFVCCPCCVGKLRSTNVDINTTNVHSKRKDSFRFARSRAFQSCVTSSSYDALATSGDWGHFAEASLENWGGLRVVAKTLLELDRAMWIEETFNYYVRLCKMEPLHASPKNDIIVGLPKRDYAHVSSIWRDNADTSEDKGSSRLPAWIERLRSAILRYRETSEPLSKTVLRDFAVMEFGEDDVDRVDGMLAEFARDESKKALVFPQGEGSRGRKLAHFLADLHGLKHWSRGKGAKRAVVVEKLS